MKKLIKIFIILLLTPILLLACSNYNDKKEQSTENSKQTSINKDIIQAMESKLEEKYGNIEVTEALASMIGAVEGKKIRNEDFVVEVYKYDKDALELKTAIKTKKVVLGGLAPFAVEVNGQYVIFTANVPQDIIDYFLSL